MSLPPILFEDKHLLVCLKPAGVLAEGSGKDGGLPGLFRDYLSGKGESPSLLTVHRLDRPVGGITVLAKTKAAAGRLSAAIADRHVEKEYLAVLRGKPEKEEDTLRDLLFRDAAKGKTYVVNRMRRGVREALLSYSLLAVISKEEQERSLVRIRLHTGRTHQIRIQFASRKLPLVGDGRYGSGDGGEFPALFAWRLKFDHPISGKPLVFSALPPRGTPFSDFQTTLDLLYKGTSATSETVGETF